jgi:MFS family permease
VAITVTFGSMVGMLFLLTQYFQFAEGYSPLQSGFRVTPIALGFVVGAVLSENLVKRYDVRAIMSTGLLMVAAAFAAVSQAIGDAPYAVLGASLFAVGFAMSFVLTPATASIMSAVPGRNVGVGSALNDAGRQVGAALGVAVLGSLAKAIYSSQLAVPTGLSPEWPIRLETRWVGPASWRTCWAGSLGDAVQRAGASAFADAMSTAMIIAAAVALVTSAVILRFMPSLDEKESPAPVAELGAVSPE